MKTVLGIDFGTQGARAVLADAENGQVLLRHAVTYAHGILPGDLAASRDYDDALMELLSFMAQPGYRESLAGICVDATSLTLVPLNAKGLALDTVPEYADHPQAKVKLWKRHHAQPWADEALSAAKERRLPVLRRTGGTISCEWTLPKLLEIHDEAPEIWKELNLVFDLCDYLTYRLTGRITRSQGSMCFKSLWAEDLGFPSDEYLNALRPDFSNRYRYLLRGPVLPPGTAAGSLRPELCRRFGFPSTAIVAAGILDGHTALAALGALKAGDAALVAGTSNVLTLQANELREIEGICGIARDSFVPGLYGVDAGQACTGDMLTWYVRNALPESAWTDAKAQGISPHEWLCKRIRQPWSDQILAVDWFNGSRNVPCDLTLSGAWLGLTLDTKPEDIYLALLQSIVCGTREILEQCKRFGVTVRRFFAAGGVAEKNPLLMQLYADILNLPVQVGQTADGPALGATIYAAAAAGLYPHVQAAHAQMGSRDFTVFTPDTVHHSAYDALYWKHHAYRAMLMQFQQNP